MNDININSWREKLGIVMQENFFKNDTLSSNIALGKKIHKKKIKEVLIRANAWDFISLLPNGIDELILDRGLRFSGGERQRIALARALYHDPEVLILDEPTTGLDKISENKLISSLKKLKGKINIIIISHKKEVVEICDKVLTLDNKGLKEN
jgi:ABC-type bacteriocin/lantibiotic exporter with double-glycine peptidase domain